MIKVKNIYIYTLIRFAIAVLLLLLSQWFFYLFNQRIFHIENAAERSGIIWGNVRFALTTMALVLAPYIVLQLLPTTARWNNGYRRFSERILYNLPIIIILAFNSIDLIYYQFTYRRMTAEIFTYVGVGGNMWSLIPRFIVDYWYGILLFVVLVLLLHYSHRLIVLSPLQGRYYVRYSDLVIIPLSIALVVVMARGGLQHDMLRPSDAARYGQAKYMPLVVNSGFSVMRTIGTGGASAMPAEATSSSVDDGEIELPQHLPFTDTTALNSSAYSNVVVIILESFSQEYMGFYNKDANPSYTPFLDSLARHSITFCGRSNGKESVEGVAAVLAGMPSLTERPFILSEACSGEDTIVSLPRLFARHGYRTAFFHGSYKGVLGFDRFCERMGVDRYYDKDDFIAYRRGDNREYDHTWGIYDEPYLQYVVRQIDTMHRPFFASVFTLSSHHPYGLPDGYDSPFPKKPHPLLRTIAYTDHALQQFFAAASKRKWYANTLFIITGDHPGQGLTPAYNDYDGWYDVPMLFYCPSDSVSYHSQRIMQQIDIMPTVADMMHLADTFACLGTSAVRYPDAGWQVVYGGGYHMLLTQDERRADHHRVATMAGSIGSGSEADRRRLIELLRIYNAMIQKH